MRLDWSAYRAAQAHIDENLSDAESIVDDVTYQAQQSIERALEETGIGIIDAIIGAVSVTADLASGLLDSLMDGAEYWGGFFDGIRNQWNEHQSGIGQSIFNILNSLLRESSERWQGGPDVREWLDRAKPDRSITDARTVEDYTAAWLNQPLWVQKILNTLAAAAGIYSISQARIAGFLSGVQQTSLQETQPTPLSVGQLTELLKRRAIGEDWAKDHAKRSGVSSNLFDLAFKLEQQRLTPEMYVTTWLRTKREEHLDEIRKQGVSDEDIERLLFLAFAEPTPSDIVRFLVRDAYDEDIVRQSGLDTDFQNKYKQDAFDRVGVSEDLARLYWRAHWQLPSPTQGYQMLYRSGLSVDDLRTLLKQADYAPAYVDHLIKIAYNVPGRIDLRRMWEVGAITDKEELIQRYMHLGYERPNAELLASFSITLSDKTKHNEAERKRNPIAREIIKSYVQGTMPREMALQSLINLGLTPEESEARISEGDYGRERDRADRIRDAIGRLYTKGQIDRDNAVSRLQSYGFFESEVATMFQSWDIDRELRDITDAERAERDLSRTDIVGAFEHGLLTPADAYAGLLQLGYDEQESSTILELSAAKQARAEAKLEQDSIRVQYISRRIDRGEATARLDSVGTVANRRESLLERWTVEREERTPDLPISWVERLIFNALISQDEARTELERRGFSPQEVDWALRLWGEEVSVARERLAGQERRFQQSSEQRAQEFAARISVQERALALRDRTATTAQILQQERFERTLEQRDRLQAEREDAAAAGRVQSAALTAERDAKQLAARREQQDRAIEAQITRLTRQIEAQDRAREDAQAFQRDLETQRNDIRLRLAAAQDARQQATLQAQADRLTRQIEAQNARAQAADQVKLTLQERAQIFQDQQRQAREAAASARQIEAEAARIRSEIRGEARVIRTETRAGERRTIERADAAAAADRLRSLALQRENLIADITAQLASLEAAAAEDRIAQAEAQASEARGRLERMIGPALVFEPTV